MWMDEVTGRLQEIYGRDQAKRICMTIMPSCMADFEKMLKKARPGVIVKETYRTEDKLAVLLFTGKRTGDGCILDSVEVNGYKIMAGAGFQ
ncbi:MAG: hypothetical protein J5966_01540 [Lachnospiraceae bacterium]|nr:hypothetical protein [Lachnospiraceae bacterium]